MLFKTQSASVYGIDAYKVEVEVDEMIRKYCALSRRKEKKLLENAITRLGLSARAHDRRPRRRRKLGIAYGRIRKCQNSCQAAPLTLFPPVCYP